MQNELELELKVVFTFPALSIEWKFIKNKNTLVETTKFTFL